MVIGLETRWKDMEIDLLSLSECVQDFFKGKGFHVVANKSDNEYRIVVKPRVGHKVIENIYVNIIGGPNDFAVKFSAGSRSHVLTFLGSLMALLGGGTFAVRGFKSEEALDKLERDFRVFIAEKVWQLRRVI
jgi:hypothetical protein